METMSIIYFLAPFQRQRWIEAHNTHQSSSLSHLQINPVDYAKALSERWSSVKFVPTTRENDSYFALTWELPEEHEGYSGLRGNLYSNLQVVSFSRAVKQTFVSFVLWYRPFVPSHYPIYLLDSISPQSLRITTNTPEDAISLFVGYTD
jgi:hypothetical protein